MNLIRNLALVSFNLAVLKLWTFGTMATNAHHTINNHIDFRALPILIDIQYNTDTSTLNIS